MMVHTIKYCVYNSNSYITIIHDKNSYSIRKKIGIISNTNEPSPNHYSSGERVRILIVLDF